MGPTPPQPDENTSLGPYWRALSICLVLLAVYIAAILTLHTETATRSTAPPWYAWVRFPKVHTRPETVFLVFPAIVYAVWLGVIRRMRSKPLSDAIFLPLACVAVFAMNVTTALTDGSVDAISKPFNWGGSEYFSDVGAVRGVATFLHGYVANLYHYSIHTRTHPPGAVLFLYFVARIIQPGVRTAAWSAVAVTATGVVPFFLLGRRIAGEKIAAIATALYVVTPSLVIYGATSMDGVFLVSLLWSMYFLYRAVEERGIGIAIVAGILLAISFSLSYVAVCIVALIFVCSVLEVAKDRGEFWPAVRAFVLCGSVVLAWFAAAYALSGFNYFACLRASRYYDRYSMRTSTMSFGRYLDISVCNLIAFLIGVGFAAIVLWWKQTSGSLKSPRNWSKADRFNAATVICVIGFSFAKLFTHETERIWLFFIPPALLGAAAWIARTRGGSQRLLEWAMHLMFVQTWVFQLLLFTIW
ncbi:MAG TPA: glycosyltransferase family 39 protein [Tepidisphaeraceae bacterium]|nr:glycosyltransferase family 39 protein [Tepidisphaeraceae bacterium]